MKFIFTTIVLYCVLAHVVGCSQLPNFSSDVKRIIIKIDPNCKDILAVDSSRQWGPRYFLENSDNVHVRECEVVLFPIKKILHDVAGCMHNGRSKRSLFDMTLKLGAEVLGYGITNFINSRFLGNNDIKNPNNLSPQLVDLHDQTKEFLKNLRGVSAKRIQAISESSPHHPKQLSNVVWMAPKFTWGDQYFQSEILAAFANLQSVSEYCSRGLVATAEVAELSGNEDLASIAPEDTELLRIDVDIGSRTIDIIFRIKTGLICQNVVYFTVAGVVIGVIAVVSLIYCAFRGSKPERIYVENTPWA